MSEAFPVQVTSRDPRGGLIMISAQKDVLHITVSFQIAPGDPVADEVRRRLGGDGQLDFSYRTMGFNQKPFMTELAAAVKHLHEAFNGAFQRTGSAFRNAGGLEHDKLRSALRPLAELGYQIFTLLFQLDDTPGYNSDDIDRSQFQTYGHILRRWLRDTETLQIVAPRHVIPWPVLYPDDIEDNPFEVYRFWAFAKTLQLLDVGLARFVNVDSAWRLTTAVEGTDHRVSTGAKVHRQPEHPFVRLRERVRDSSCPRKLFRWFADADVLYHFGHASSSSRGFEFGQISLNGNDLKAATLEALLSSRKIALPKREPLLVFLNGCSTAVEAGEGETIPAVLIKHGRGRFYFVATLGAVPDWPAARFAEKFFRAYLPGVGVPGQSLGESMQHARREMLQEHGSPVGLLYVAYGKTGTAIPGDGLPRPLTVDLEAAETVGE